MKQLYYVLTEKELREKYNISEDTFNDLEAMGEQGHISKIDREEKRLGKIFYATELQKITSDFYCVIEKDCLVYITKWACVKL